MFSRITNVCMTILTALTAFGVFMHDGHIDKAMTSRLDESLDAAHIAKSGHAHADFNVNDFLMSKSQAYTSPATPAKSRSERKRRLQMPSEFGRHAFDDIFMPLLT